MITHTIIFLISDTLCTTPRFLTECQQINRTNDIQCIVLEDELSCVERVDGGGATFASVSAEGAFLGAGKINLATLATFQLAAGAIFCHFDPLNNFMLIL